MLAMAQKGINKLVKLIRKLELLPVFIGREIGRIIEQESQTLAFFNVAQLNKGIDSDEKSITYQKTRRTPKSSAGTYSANYAKRKSSQGGRTDIVDMKNTGGFHDSITVVKKDNREYVFKAKEDLEKFLKANYGNAILGISEKNLNEFTNNILTPILTSRIDRFLTV